MRSAFFSACLLLLLLSPNAGAWDNKYDLHFKRWGEYYFPFEQWQWWKAQGIAESLLDPAAVSWCGARGIMQLMPATAAELGVVNSFDPEVNIQGGIKYDRKVYRMLKDRDLMFAGYNAGPGHIKKALRLSPCTKCHDKGTWPMAAAQLSRVTGKNSKETIGYVTRINVIKGGL